MFNSDWHHQMNLSFENYIIKNDEKPVNYDKSWFINIVEKYVTKKEWPIFLYMGIHTIHTKSLLIILVRSWFFLSVAVWTQLDFLNKKNKKQKQKKIIIKYSFDNIECWSIKKLRWYLSQTIWGMSNAGCFFQYYLHGSVGQHRVDIVLISYKHL